MATRIDECPDMYVDRLSLSNSLLHNMDQDQGRVACQPDSYLSLEREVCTPAREHEDLTNCFITYHAMLLLQLQFCLCGEEGSKMTFPGTASAEFIQASFVTLLIWANKTK